jgi:hypothetical protein
MLAVVVADVEIDAEFHFERQKVGTTPAPLSRQNINIVYSNIEIY